MPSAMDPGKACGRARSPRGRRPKQAEQGRNRPNTPLGNTVRRAGVFGLFRPCSACFGLRPRAGAGSPAVGSTSPVRGGPTGLRDPTQPPEPPRRRWGLRLTPRLACQMAQTFKVLIGTLRMRFRPRRGARWKACIPARGPAIMPWRPLGRRAAGGGAESPGAGFLGQPRIARAASFALPALPPGAESPAGEQKGRFRPY